MKKSINTHLILIGLSSVIALTACERRERPTAKAKTNTVSTNTTQPSPTVSTVPSTTPSTTPSNTPSNTPSDTPTPVASPLSEEQFMSIREKLVNVGEAMKTAGYELVITADAEGLPVAEYKKESLEAVREKLTNAEGSNRDLAEHKMNCDLTSSGIMHKVFAEEVESKGTEGIDYGFVKAEVAKWKAIVKATEDAQHHLGITELVCAPAPSPAPVDAE